MLIGASVAAGASAVGSPSASAAPSELAAATFAPGREGAVGQTAATEAAATAKSDAIGPISISDASSLAHIPRDARLVKWHWARSSGMKLEEAALTLKPGEILVLPEDEQPYEVDSSKGFKTDGHCWHSMCKVGRGIVGLGPGAVIQPSASSYREGRQRSGPVQNKVIDTSTPNAYFGNFTMRGRDFGGVAYHALYALGNDTVFERLHLEGAHRGFADRPPGEAGAISVYKGARPAVYGVEIDCRDPQTGTSVGTSPMMFNRNTDARVQDVYAHHTKIGMPTFWECTNAHVTRLQHTDCGVVGDSPGVNMENTKGLFIFDEPTFHLTGASNNGRHINIGGTRGCRGKVAVLNPRYSSRRDGATFTVQQWGGQSKGAVHYDYAGLKPAGSAAGRAAPSFKVFG